MYTSIIKENLAGAIDCTLSLDIPVQTLAAVLGLTFVLCGRVYRPGPYTNVKPGRKVPAKPGAERYISKKTKKVVYQGETSNLRSKISKQKSDKMPYTRGNYQAQYKVADGRSTSNTRRKHEKAKIQQHRPKFNKKAGGGGRKAKGGSGRRKGGRGR